MISEKEIDELMEMAKTHPRTAIMKAFGEGRLRAGKNAKRYKYLRERDLDTISKGGIFAGMTPNNVILNGSDLDKAIDDAMAS